MEIDGGGESGGAFYVGLGGKPLWKSHIWVEI